MTNFLSPQQTQIYNLLLKHKSLTAKEIGSKLSIFPHAVYRANKSLIDYGLIEETDNYPVEFKAKPVADALDSYLLAQRESFLQSFKPNGQRVNISDQILDIAFIQSREELLERTNEDMLLAKHEVCILVSGIEVPAETMLARKKAIEKGVSVKIIVQNMEEATHEMLENWKKIGLEIRHHPLLEARLLLFDSKIAYISSYNPKKKEEAIGIRFNYPPIAKLMRDLFNERWQKAKVI